MGPVPTLTPDVLLQMLLQQQQQGQGQQPAEQMSQQGQFNPADIQAQLQGGGGPQPFSFAPVQGGVGRNILNALANAGKAATYVAEDPMERRAEDARAQQLYETKQKMAMAAGEFGQREKDRAAAAATQRLEFAQRGLDRKAQLELAKQVERDRNERQDALFKQQQALEDQREGTRQSIAAQAEKTRQQQQQDLFAQQEKQQSRSFAEQEKLERMRESARQDRADQKNQQLTPATQGILQSTAPVKDQVQQLLSSLDDYIKQKKGNETNRLTLDRAGYALGFESPEGNIADQISKLELDRVMAGARVLKGSSRAYQALELAMKHAPNPWVDQVGLMRQKLSTILQNLNDVEKDAVQFGTKGQTAGQIQGQYGPGSQLGRPTPSQPSGNEIHYKIVNGQLVPQ